MPSSTESKIAMANTVFHTISSLAAAAMVARHYMPHEFRDYLYFGFRNFINKFSTQLTMVIYEFDGFLENEIYNATQLYLASRISFNIHRQKVTKNPSEKNIKVAMEINEEFTDVYNGVKFKWSLISKKTPTRECYNINDDMTRSTRSDERTLELTFHRKHRDLALNDYLPFILNDVTKRKREEKTVKLFTVDMKKVYTGQLTWTSVNLDHPANFSTLAMDAGVKEKVMKDLDRFVSKREYYRKVGKAWKRGYLLYGPPGTGKSSLIAAMANYLKFDIYDMELTDIRSNSELRRLLVATGNRSILVVEDIDCSVELHDRVATEAVKALAWQNHPRGGYMEEQKVTLSGFLNFIDGLWSSCGDERIIIFTTNRKDKLDQALLRPGRMDVHIHMSYCTSNGFRLLASNYLNITEHDLFEEIEDLIREVEITPAEIAEQLLKDEDPDIALGGLIEFFDVKRKENEEAKERAKEEELAAKEREKLKQANLGSEQNCISYINKAGVWTPHNF